MIQEVQRLLDEYLAWLRDKTVLRQIDDWVEITTPYMDRHNDRIQIYAKRHNSGFVLTDDGYTISDLQDCGCKRRDLLQTTLNGFGVQLVDSRLEVHASNDNFASRKHNLVQAMLAVNAMLYLAAPAVGIAATVPALAEITESTIAKTDRGNAGHAGRPSPAHHNTED